MKKFFKNPLKVILAGMFVVAMGFGMSTSLSVSESNGNIDLLALNSAVAQGEYNDCRNGRKIAFICIRAHNYHGCRMSTPGC